MPGVLSDTLGHLLNNVLPAVAEYQAAEDNLSSAHTIGPSTEEENMAKRKAAELAVAIDGLSDRAHLELKISLETIRTEISALCVWPGTQTMRPEAFQRIYGVANAYKHSVLTKKMHVINSFDDVLVVGLGFGLDGFDVGKCSGVEVLVKDKQGTSWKFLGDAPTVISAWFRYLHSNNAMIPDQTFKVCGVQVHP